MFVVTIHKSVLLKPRHLSDSVYRFVRGGTVAVAVLSIRPWACYPVHGRLLIQYTDNLLSCHCPHKCLGSVHTSAMSLSTQASCHYTHKRQVNIQRCVTSLSRLVFQTSVVFIQTSVTSLSKQATSLSKQATSLSKQASRHYPNNRRHYPNKRRHYPNKRHVIIQTSVTSLSKQARHYSNKHSNPSTDTPHRGGMNMYTHINYLQSVQQ